jgi:uncharacterized protein (TIGR02246 family)
MLRSSGFAKIAGMSATVAYAFVEAINHRDAEEIGRLMTEDHVFIDSLGNKVTGREQMKRGWQAYFGMVPDYSIEIEETFTGGPVVIMLGAAEGTYSTGGDLRPENQWRTPAAWRAVIQGMQVAEWRVYADNEPIRRIMAANTRS